jgi:hypothetical protein
VLIIGAIVAAAIAWGAYGKLRENADAAEVQAQTLDFKPTVRVVAARRDADPLSLTLPGDHPRAGDRLCRGAPRRYRQSGPCG